MYFSGGRGRVITETATYHCSAGTLIVIPPRLVHCTIVDDVAERWCIHFDFYGQCRAQQILGQPYIYLDDNVTYDEQLTAPGLPPQLEVRFPLSRQLTAAQMTQMAELLRHYWVHHADDFAGVLFRRSLLLRILALALGDAPPPGKPEPDKASNVFFAAKGLIDRHFHRPKLTVADIAATLRVTPNHLLKLFRRELALSTSEYLQNRRLIHAAGLLKENRLNIAEVAAASGFDDANYFSRLFRQKNQLTPLQYRRRQTGP